MSPSTSQKQPLAWRNILFLSGTLAASLVGLPWRISTHGVELSLVLFFVLTYSITNLSITAGYHRHFAHRSYEARPWFKMLILFIGAGAFQGSVLQWSADHRRHHNFVDTGKDPHDINRGFWFAHWGWLWHLEAPQYRGKFPPDLLKDKWVVFQHRYYPWLALGVGFLLPAVVGYIAFGTFWGGLLYGGILRAVASNHSTFLINSLAHTHGSRPYNREQTARDSWLMAFLAFGEGFHNYHHVFASDFRNGIRWYHWDPTKWLIQTGSWIGATYQLKRANPSDILRARLKNEQSLLVAMGFQADRVQAMKQRLEEAQKHLQAMREDYRKLKANVQMRSRSRLRQMRFEMRVARQDFKRTWALWVSYRKQAVRIGLPA
jgi:stearoyl-CoA desaturase (delta-9 desaturase)